jgi:hypothetical protein
VVAPNTLQHDESASPGSDPRPPRGPVFRVLPDIAGDGVLIQLNPKARAWLLDLLESLDDPSRIERALADRLRNPSDPRPAGRVAAPAVA